MTLSHGQRYAQCAQKYAAKPPLGTGFGRSASCRPLPGTSSSVLAESQMRNIEPKYVKVFRIVMIVSVAFVAGCAHWDKQQPGTPVDPIHQADGRVNARILDVPSSEQYRMAANGHFSSPTAFSHNPMPQYPEALLVRRLPPAEVRIRVVVDADGVVTSTSPVGDVGPDRQSFVDATIAAVTYWQFTPLYMTDEQGQWQKMPFHQDYAFTFTQVDGKGSVVESPRNSEP